MYKKQQLHTPKDNNDSKFTQHIQPNQGQPEMNFK